MRVPVGSVVRRWGVALVAFLTAVTGAVVVGAVPAAAAAPASRPPIVTKMWPSDFATVVVFKDRSVDEDAFQLFRRGLNGHWEYVVEAPTQDKHGRQVQSALVDFSPNALRCYMVAAYDNAGFVTLHGRPECVDGGLDPFDTRSGTRVAAPRVTALARTQSGSDIQVRVDYVDRSRNESQFKLFRRHGDALLFIGQTSTSTRAGVGQSRSFTDTLPAGTPNACYTVQAIDDVTGASTYSNEVCLTPSGPPASPTGRAVSRPIRIDLPGFSTHMRGSVAVGGDGLPIMSVTGRLTQDSSGSRLGVVHCNDATCASSTSAVFNDVVAYESTVTIGQDGLAFIAYRTGNGVAVAHCTSPDCAAISQTTLDTPPGGASVPSVSIGRDGLPMIAYRAIVGAGQPDLVKVARCNNLACTTATINGIATVPTEDDQAVAIATSPVTGYTYVAYSTPASTGTENVVTVVTCPRPGCTSGRTVSTVDWGHPGEFQSGLSLRMAVGQDGLPLLAYHAHGDIVAARCSNIFCNDVTKMVVNEPESYDASSPGNIALAVGTDGLGRIAYNGRTGTVVVLCNDLACRSASVAHTTTTGSSSASIAIGADGLPLVFHGDTQTSMRLVHCPNAACSGGPFTRPETTGRIRGIEAKCLEVLLASTDNGTPIQIITCSGHIAQSWRVGGDGTLRALGKCLDIAAANTANGTPIQLYDCHGHWAQVWEPRADGTLRNPVSGKCLDTAGHGSGEWTRLVLWECIPNTPSQSWFLPAG